MPKMDPRWLHPWSTELAHVQLDLLCAWQAAQLDQLGQQPEAARQWVVQANWNLQLNAQPYD